MNIPTAKRIRQLEVNLERRRWLDRLVPENDPLFTHTLDDEGKVVGVYPEGERSWDGVLQPFRRGTVRLLLKVGVPIVPCGLEGSFDVWPRWGAGIRRADVTIRFGEPIHLGRHDDRRERERLLPETQETLAKVLRRLSGEPEDGFLASAAEHPRGMG